ncbi:hypothetical protein F4782DRAFT_533462 [Xylaria castorea]|nr:hypothetical protein F4782DRAFT_533462 [Xylaria castorea]
MAITYDTKMAYLRLAIKAAITFLMIWMLHSAHTAAFAFGMLFCCMFGSDYGFFQPSIDLFLFLGTATRSKYIEESAGPHEPLLDISIICLVAFYWVIDDIFRVALLGAWLPYQYLGIDRSRCWGYLTLAVMVPMLPHFCCALYETYRVYWPKFAAKLLHSVEMAFSNLRAYVNKTIESAFPPAPPPSHLLQTLTISPVIIAGNVEPSTKPKSMMVDSNTQTDPPTTTSSGTQWEQPLLFRSPEVVTRHIATANGITILPPDFEMPNVKRQEPSRVRKQQLRDLARRRSPTKASSPVISRPASPIKSIMFTPISASTLLAPISEASVSPPVPVVDSTLALSPPWAPDLPTGLVSVAAAQDIPATPIPASELPASLPVPAVDTVIAPTSSREATSLSVPVSMPTAQDISTALAPISELPASFNIFTVDPILESSVLLSAPIFDLVPASSSSFGPSSPTVPASVPAAQDVSAAPIPISELPAFLPVTTVDTITELLSSPQPALLFALPSVPVYQDMWTGQSLIPTQAWPELIPEPEPELGMAVEAMEVDFIPPIENFPTLPVFTLDSDEPMPDTALVINTATTPVIPCAMSPVISPITAVFAPVEGMIIDEEPVLTPESREVVMEEEQDDEDPEDEDENEEEMEDVPDLPPSTPAAAAPFLLTPPITPIAFSMAPSPNAPKLDRRFIIDNTPTRPTCNIHALDPNYKPPRKLDILPRVKEVYVEEFEDNDGYRQKVRWDLRDSPALDDSAVVQLELLMNDAAEEAREAWSVRQAGLEEQAAIDLAAKKERDKQKFEARRKARVAAFLKRQQEKKEKGPSIFIQKKKKC